MIGDYQFAEGEDIRTIKANNRLMRVVGWPRLSQYERWGGVYYYEWVNQSSAANSICPGWLVPGN